MTYQETATKVYEMRNMGITYGQIAKELDLPKSEILLMGSADIRSDVRRKCDDCGKQWSASVFPWDKYTLHRCVECASIESVKVVGRNGQ